LGNNLAPTQANADALAAAQQAAPAQPQGKPSIYQERLGEAQALRNAGFHAQADAAEKAALAFAPKVKNWQEVKVGDSVRYAPFYEDGTSGQPVTLEVARKLEKANTGQATQFVDPYTGRVVSSLQNTATPGELLSASTTIRGQNLVDARTREANALKAAEGKAPTEFQGKSAAFGLRAEEANKIINDLVSKGTTSGGIVKGIAESIPVIGGGIGSVINTLPGVLGGPNDAQQRYAQAKRDFINATLRQESGAAIGANEFDNADKQYFPQPGDSPQVITQKARNRELVIQGFQGNAGKAKLTAPTIPAASGGWSIQRVGE
jgi:outer membrane lipoprotein SlyB